MIKRLIGIGLVFLLLMSIGLAAAQDDPQPGTPEENECYPGGVLYRAENQDGCPTEWYWKAGWYLAAYNNGRISREEVPDEFKSALPDPLFPSLPPPTVIDDGGVLTICYYANISNYCLRSDKTATVISPGLTYFFYLIVPETDGCPHTYNGHTLRSQGIGFPFMSANDLALLGYDYSFRNCEYDYLTNY